jgi:hypothetical protein
VIIAKFARAVRSPDPSGEHSAGGGAAQQAVGMAESFFSALNSAFDVCPNLSQLKAQIRTICIEVSPKLAEAFGDEIGSVEMAYRKRSHAWSSAAEVQPICCGLFAPLTPPRGFCGGFTTYLLSPAWDLSFGIAPLPDA